MIKKILKTPRAQMDMAEIYAYISSNFSLEKAEEYLSLIQENIERLSYFSELGVIRRHKNKRFRFYIFDQYKIIYVFSKTTLTILRVYHSARNGGDVL